MLRRRTLKRRWKSTFICRVFELGVMLIDECRLRQVDVKAEHFERQVQRAEQERDQWEKKYEVRIYSFGYRSCPQLSYQEAQEKYSKTRSELDDLVQQMEGL